MGVMYVFRQLLWVYGIKEQGGVKGISILFYILLKAEGNPFRSV